MAPCGNEKGEDPAGVAMGLRLGIHQPEKPPGIEFAAPVTDNVGVGRVGVAVGSGVGVDVGRTVAVGGMGVFVGGLGLGELVWVGGGGVAVGVGVEQAEIWEKDRPRNIKTVAVSLG